jgi:CRISPR-associated protein Cmr1
MQTITFTCEMITPMFLSGADQSIPELRPPSIKGAMRFWWRAMNGHLSLEDLKRQESLIFGGTEPAQRSRVIIRCEQKNFNIADNKYRMIAHKGGNSKCFETKQEVCITLGITQNINLGNGKVFNLDMLKALFEVFCYLGGLGKRNRRGNGGLKITKYRLNGDAEQTYTQLDFGTTLVGKLNLVCLDKRTDDLQVFNLNSTKTIIDANFTVTSRQIPHIISIEKINQQGDIESLRKKISQATHNTKDKEMLEIAEMEKIDGKNEGEYKYKLNYGKFIGNGVPRLASPLIFSILPSKEIVVTKLKTIKEIRDVATIINTSSLSIQQDLINQVKTIV